MLMAYFIFRLWYNIVKPRNVSWKKSTAVSGVSTLERLDAVWIVRSATLASELIPEINEHYGKLVSLWGREYAHQIYITDKNTENVERLKQEVAETALYRSGSFHFGRPNLESIIEEHSLELVTTHSNSYTLLSFCGSVEMSAELQRIKVTNDMVKAITGNGASHQMEFESECRAGATKKKVKNPASGTEEAGKEQGATEGTSLTRRSTILFASFSSERNPSAV
ncbi:MAG: hypothetical protein SGARI_003067 [Bacillariaceae sp.]